jgi:hypothetical protein
MFGIHLKPLLNHRRSSVTLLLSKQQLLNMTVNHCETRWCIRANALATFKATFPVIVSNLEYIYKPMVK